MCRFLRAASEHDLDKDPPGRAEQSVYILKTVKTAGHAPKRAHIKEGKYIMEQMLTCALCKVHVSY